MAGLLRICTAGSVDYGKSTLIGRLLYEARGVYEDQVRSVEAASRNRGAGTIDFSLFTDGLKAEREQGITIDVAYRYFATAKRSFILADTPGHEQYTRNMATGASTADVAILLVDARLGLRPQTLHHARIARLLGISEFILAINKMDLVAFDRAVFESIDGAFRDVLADVHVHAVPISALHGDNVTSRSPRTPWYDGPGLLGHLESVAVATGPGDAPFRYPVQLVLLGPGGFRGYAGRVASGAVRVGDTVSAWPSGRASRVARIVTRDGDRESASAPASVALALEDDLDLSRGDALAVGAPIVGASFRAHVVWMDERPLERGRVYRLKHTARTVAAEVDGALRLNEIGTLLITTSRPLIFDSYAANRTTGSFILIDAETNFTAGAGIILDAVPAPSSSRDWNGSARRLAAVARSAPTEATAATAVLRALEEILP
ncbi:MAG: sulfate adenylyltransferase subunit 1 [Gemmatimonadaceae bacterium]